MRSRVSVVIPVHNTERYLQRCFESVAAQTLGQDRIQVIAVDDGSSDGSGAWLDAWAAGHPNTTVVHQEASGGAGKPRNVGIEHATGEFVFFLDSDDYLGEEALERLVAMAEAEGSDVVYGRIVGIGGRPAPIDLRTTSPDVSIFDSPVYWTLAAYKLWRRTLIEKYELRFTEGYLLNEDLPFAVHALLHASKISVVADHDCYFLEGRGDGTNASEQDVDWVRQLAYVSGILDTVAEHVPEGADRDKLMERHFHGEVLAMFGTSYLARDGAGRREMVEAAAPLVEKWLTERITAALPPRLRLRAHHIGNRDLDRLTAVVEADTGRETGPAVIEGDRAYAAYPGFRDEAAGTPDALYDLTSRIALRHELTGYHWDGPVLRLTGRARLEGLGAATEQRAGIRLRRQGYTYWVPAETDEDGNYTAAIDVGRAADGGPLPDGIWTMRVTAAAGELGKDAWLPGPAGPGYDAAPEPRIVDRGHGAGLTPATVFLSEPHRHVNLDIGATRYALGGDARGAVHLGPLGRTTVEASATVPGWPADAPVRLVLTAPDRAPFVTGGRPGGFAPDRVSSSAGLRGVPVGTYELGLRLESGAYLLDLPVRGADGGPVTVTVRPSVSRRLARRARRTLGRARRSVAR
ncbi:glycosyltransferase family 2 protein [Streptomyces sp. NPDC093225]|uniref:glycosyltransferase family 2 protein n=1 Tax=Streptomyces sp. NPDC093225 TaxID=3366034 RepID=UPI0037F8550D